MFSYFIRGDSTMTASLTGNTSHYKNVSSFLFSVSSSCLSLKAIDRHVSCSDF